MRFVLQHINRWLGLWVHFDSSMSKIFFSLNIYQSSTHCPLCQCATVGPSKSNISDSKLCPNARSYMSPQKNQFFVHQDITKWKFGSRWTVLTCCTILDLTYFYLVSLFLSQAFFQCSSIPISIQISPSLLHLWRPGQRKNFQSFGADVSGEKSIETCQICTIWIRVKRASVV